MTDEMIKRKTKLHDAYHGLQSRLRAELDSNRSVIDHPAAKGAGSEANWINMLKQHIPHRYQVDQAFVIDSDGIQSDQIDIVIYDRQYCPVLYSSNAEKIIPAESVYAVFEVKQDLNKHNLEYAGNKVSSVRRLKRTSAQITHAGGKYNARSLYPILGGFLASSASWKPPFGDPFVNVIRGFSGENQLELGCVLDTGAFEIDYSEDSPAIFNSNPDYALASFFLRLLRQLQAIGTVPAIDYGEYLEVFNV